jgi:molybdate transport system substrate-binding protein
MVARICFMVLLLVAVSVLTCCRAEEEQSVHVAVAANFTEPAKEIAGLFERSTGQRAILSFGSTGQLFTQITQDAPFEVFLAADQETPRRTVADGFGVEDGLITYAIGKLVLFSPSLDLSQGDAVLRAGPFEKLAIANPSTAPYGGAALDALKSLGLEEQLRGKVVQGNNIAQTFQFVATGNAELGFVALSQVVGRKPPSIWIVPDSLYFPIRQDAVLLKKGAANDAARAFLEFLKSPDALIIIEKYGYAHSP